MPIINHLMKAFIAEKFDQVMKGGQVVTGTKVSIDPNSQKLAIKVLGFLSGVLQLLPIELCAVLCPSILNFSEIDDPQIKINAYLTLEVLFASRRFDKDPNTNMTLQQTLKSLLENPEIIHSVSLQDTYLDQEGNEIQGKI